MSRFCDECGKGVSLSREFHEWPCSLSLPAIEVFRLEKRLIAADRLADAAELIRQEDNVSDEVQEALEHIDAYCSNSCSKKSTLGHANIIAKAYRQAYQREKELKDLRIKLFKAIAEYRGMK